MSDFARQKENTMISALKAQVVTPRKASYHANLLAFYCERDFALMYAFRNPRLARRCALKAHEAATLGGRPDLAYEARDILSAL